MLFQNAFFDLFCPWGVFRRYGMFCPWFDGLSVQCGRPSPRPELDARPNTATSFSRKIVVLPYAVLCREKKKKERKKRSPVALRRSLEPCTTRLPGQSIFMYYLTTSAQIAPCEPRLKHPDPRAGLLIGLLPILHMTGSGRRAPAPAVFLFLFRPRYASRARPTVPAGGSTWGRWQRAHAFPPHEATNRLRAVAAAVAHMLFLCGVTPYSGPKCRGSSAPLVTENPFLPRASSVISARCCLAAEVLFCDRRAANRREACVVPAMRFPNRHRTAPTEPRSFLILVRNQMAFRSRV